MKPILEENEFNSEPAVAHYQDESDSERVKTLNVEEEPVDRDTVLPEDFVLIKFESKNSFIYYVGLVLETEKNEVKVKFTRKELSSSLKFVFPGVDDISHVNIKEIKLKLLCLTISGVLLGLPQQ